jgi:hypothetical protein
MFGFYVTLWFFFFLMFVMFGCYIKEREEKKKIEMGEGCEL